MTMVAVYAMQNLLIIIMFQLLAILVKINLNIFAWPNNVLFVKKYDKQNILKTKHKFLWIHWGCSCNIQGKVSGNGIPKVTNSVLVIDFCPGGVRKFPLNFFKIIFFLSFIRIHNDLIQLANTKSFLRIWHRCI